MNKKLHTYAFDLISYDYYENNTCFNRGTYFIKFDHFPNSKDIDNAIYLNYKEYREKYVFVPLVFTEDALQKFDIYLCNTSTNKFLFESNLVAKYCSSIYRFVYINIRKID